ncbi:hypothetical protein M8J76_007920 [Diaphorina citri]|nr:hypothetical protein M8J76_007920 [Diaphorina citri]
MTPPENGRLDAECTPGQFSCGMGKCIPESWKCDGFVDCLEDGSDEPNTCIHQCFNGQVQCALSKKCIPHNWLCDEEMDCSTDDIVDNTDEDWDKCHNAVLCHPNELRCGSSNQCVALSKFCDGKPDCSNGEDEGPFCNNKADCENLKCSHKCSPTPRGAMCFCPAGQNPNKTQCVDADECLIDGSCDQTCTNTHLSYVCSCTEGYTLRPDGKSCTAINVPQDEPASIIFSSTVDIRRIHLNGSAFNTNSILNGTHTLALEFNHRNQSLCFIQQQNVSSVRLRCAQINDLLNSWDLPAPEIFPLDAMTHVALDWISGNWYFLDDGREAIYFCTHYMEHCMIAIDLNLSKPRGIALDPTSGYMFFTKWGATRPMLERSLLDGTERFPMVTHKIVYPYGVTVDFPNKHVYWVDTYLDFIDRINYDGTDRKTIRKGFPVQNLYDITVFENNLFVTSWRNQSIIRVNKFNSDDYETIANFSRPFAIHIYHRQKQPDVSHPCSKGNGGCRHFCIPKYINGTGVARCVCEAGYSLTPTNKCVSLKPSTFLLYAKGKPAIIKGLTFKRDGTTEQAIMPITDLKRPSVIDYHEKEEYIYYAELTSYVIERRKMFGRGKEVVIDTGIYNVEGMAVDWMANNLYWTDAGIGTINVAKISDFSIRKVLYKVPKYLPRSLVLHPKTGYMFWAFWSLSPSNSSDGGIEKAGMHGENRSPLVTKNIQWPSSLVIDYNQDVLYWCDSHLNTVESVRVDGSERTMIIDQASGLVKQPSGLAFYEGELFIAEFQRGSIKKYNLASKKMESFYIEDPPIYDLKMLHKRETGENQCSAKNNVCKDLCLTTPTGIACACRTGYILNEQHECVLDKTAFPAPKNVCNEDQFQCESGKVECIDKFLMCNGEKDCTDGSDEEQGPGKACESKKKPDCGLNDTSDEDHCERSCLPTEFTCANKQCLSWTFYCDGFPDCRDGSDETECLPTCGDSTHIMCRIDNKCIPAAKKCDGVNDCTDWSDETNCTHSGNRTISAPACEPHEFDCQDVLRTCIPKALVCDGEPACFNGEDEMFCDTIPVLSTSTTPRPDPEHCEYPNRLCDNTTCIPPSYLCNSKQDCLDGSDEGPIYEKQCLRSDCHHDCYNTPEGFMCVCPRDMYLQPDLITCSYLHPCEAWGTCSQDCEPSVSNNSYKCTCHAGYELEPDMFTCKSKNDSSPFVIFSNRHELRGVDLRTFNVIALISSLKNTIALDFYYTPTANMVFWTDVIDDKIYNATLIGNSLSNIDVVVQTGLSTAEGLAVDWIGKNLYWVESNLDQIEVAKLSGQFRRTLIAGDMESPRAIALDPRFGLLFWTDWDSKAPRIERCSMSGEHRSVIVRVDLLTSRGAWPNGLTLDYQLTRIYWIDAKSDSIHTVTYDGKDHHVVLSNHDSLTHPFAIALFENHVYWTDWRTNSVIRANKWNGSDVTLIQRTLTQPFDIQIFHSSRQPIDVNGVVKKSPCEMNNGNCSHLCLIGMNGTYKCQCPHVMKLMSDNKTCQVADSQFIIFSRPREIRGVDLEHPYYHTIPTISIPQVFSPNNLNFDAANKKIYWTDQEYNEVKRSSIVGGQIQLVVDAGISHPSGLAIDWIAQNMFIAVSSPTQSKIVVCNLEGEYQTTILSNESNDTSTLSKISSIAVWPVKGKMFWSNVTKQVVTIEMAFMDGTKRETVVSQKKYPAVTGVSSLMFDAKTKTLFWINPLSHSLHYVNIEVKVAKVVSMPDAAQVVAAVFYKGRIIYSDANDGNIRSINLDGSNSTVLRNNAANISSLNIYDPHLQTGSNVCEQNKGNCSHLCIPKGSDHRVCMCATGYSLQSDGKSCAGISDFILFSVNSGYDIMGIKYNKNESKVQQVLGPLSKVSLAAKVDFHAAEDYIYWVDIDHGTISRTHRDGTGRENIIEYVEIGDPTPVDQFTDIAVDWIAQNIYWSDPKENVIEVARLTGQYRYVLISGGVDQPSALAVDPESGYLFWSESGKIPLIARAGLDGKKQTILAQEIIMPIKDITLDRKNKRVYWCYSVGSNVLESMDYSGGSKMQLKLSSSIKNAVALNVFENNIYWADTNLSKGNIHIISLSNLSDVSTISMKPYGDSYLKDIKIYSKDAQTGTNPCGVNNGGCAELCLYNEYDAFIMYSRVNRIDSIHMTDKSDLNSPFESIRNSTMMKNIIELSYDYKRKTLFYSDIQKGTINSVFFNGTNHRVLLERQGSVEGLAYEYVHNYLYWTCNNDATINKIDLDSPKAQRIVVVRLGQHDKPRGIDIDSCDSRIYWTNWNSHLPSIQRAFFSGFGTESIITTDITMPNALALDHQAEKLFWGDARLDKIERCDYDGTNRIVLSKISPLHPFDMAVYGEFIFWTDWVIHAVLRANKYTGEEVYTLRKNIRRPMGIVAISDNLDACAKTPCRHLNGNCDDICKLDETGQVVCSCFTGKVLMEDNRSCTINTNDCFDMSDEQNCDQIKDVSPKMNCSGDKFLCRNGNCILSRWRCDGDNDCNDGNDGLSSDEMNCDTESTCKANNNVFQCDNNKTCISKSWVCDGTYDCTDRSDENSTYCAHSECNLFEFRCNSTGQCIPITWVCDGVTDCIDKSDEHHSQDCLNVETCLEGYFKCLNGRCLLENYYCDGENDCGDNSDEPPSCPKTDCDNSTHFECQNGNCIPSVLLCNGVNDCDDNSDEDMNHAECRSLKDLCKHPSHFLCSNGLCINETLTCNDINDCGDNSDEFSCFVNECNVSHGGQLCAHECIDLKIGYKCACRKGYQVHPEDKHLCVDTNECLDRPCSHYCRNTLGSYSCSCAPGYALLSDKHGCKATSDVPPNLLFTNKYYIREVTQAGVMTIRIHNQTNAVGLDFDWVDNCLYWSDVTMHGSSIRRSCNNSQPELLFPATSPDGLTVDWVGRNLYWCDKGLDTIEVAKLDGRFRKVLINKGLQEPRGIALNPAYGYMYWTDWGQNAHIGKAKMDGSNPKVIISKNLSWPNALTISYETNELFWGDAHEDYIAVSDLNGENIKIIVSRRMDPTINLHHVFALAVFEDHLFWTDWEMKSIERCDKYTGKNCTSVVKNLVHKPMDLRVYHPYRQTPLKDNPCENNGGCQGLCLLKPNGHRQCACPDNFILESDGKTCRHNCSAGQFLCEKTMKCIPFWWKCDTQDDCGDKSDEHDQCPQFHCLPGQFQCNNTKCLHPNTICDGVNNCGDMSDELHCVDYTCLNTQFKCKRDPAQDCWDGSDEANCTTKCKPNMFTCANHQCISLNWRCDGEPDCSDNSDEIESICAGLACEPNRFKCKNNKCIHRYAMCDGIDNCGDNSDESHCPSIKLCSEANFKCANGNCIKKELECDQYNDCGDNSDEEGCDSPLCKFRTCSQICIEKKISNTEKTFSCHCAEGYHMVHGKNKTSPCVANGKSALLLIAHTTLKVLDPYASRAKSEISPLNLDATKIYSVDLLYEDRNNIVVYWVDRHAKVIKMASISSGNVTRVKREMNLKTVLSNLHDPRGVAVDWVGKNLYWTDAGGRSSNNIMVSTLEGRKKRTLLNTGLNEPYDIALEPLSGRMFWTELGIKPRISGASIDGKNKFNLVDNNIQWPTGITIDYPSQRLYWADPKARTIESINLNGKDRFVVYHTEDNGYKPYKLEVFEDNLYFSTYRTNNILKINKFGNSDFNVLANNLNRASDVLILQENKQAHNVTNHCDDKPCHQSALCINLPSSHTCLCPDHLTEELNVTSGKMSCKVAPARTCYLDCNHGTCEFDDDFDPHCICQENFYGTYCEKVNNSMCPCLNQGMCYPDLTHPEPTYKCHCAPNYTGARCESRICENKCHNGGTCIATTQTCVCPPGFTGDTCQQCLNLKCQNGGVCVNKTTGLECDCPKFYYGKNCQYSQCKNYCVNGECSITDSGPKCMCSPGYSGKKCDTCTCLNGGTCIPNSKNNVCKCPSQYTGRRCECAVGDTTCASLANKCTPNYCSNNGTCVLIEGKPSCKCLPPYSGKQCTEREDSPSCHNYCDNAGLCSYSKQGKPVCTCVNGWSGITCSERVSCAHFCFNGGTCREQNYSLDPDLKPICICPRGYAGVRCQTLVHYISKKQSYVNSHISSILILILLLITVGGIGYYIFRIKMRSQFMHVRMPDNIEINNPMYLREDIDDEGDILERNFAIDTDRNPVYESMYNAKLPGANEEKKGLLHELQERVRDPLTSSAERL